MTESRSPLDYFAGQPARPRHTPVSRTWIAAGTLLLILLSAGPIYQGIRLLLRPAQIRAQTYPRTIPTTGPYTDGELDAAAMDWRQLSGVLRDNIPPEELAPLAESRRRQEDFRQSGWQRRKDAAIAQAEGRRFLGWLLIALGGGLMLVFAILGRMALSSPVAPVFPTGEETPPPPR